MLCGTYEVYENRETRNGRKIALNLAVLPATGNDPAPDPIFYLAGGPGGSAVNAAGNFASSVLRQEREIVLIDQRGTGASNPLQCEMPGGAENLQGYLDGDFKKTKPIKKCKRALKKIAKLKTYTAPVAVDDLDEIREAMGYEQVNLIGNSWGSRTGLVYMRRHPERVRSAVLKSLVPLAITYPLYHARGAQDAVDLILEECAQDSSCAAAFPRIDRDFAAVVEELRVNRAPVTITHPETSDRVEVMLSLKAFGEGVRWLMFVGPEWLPQLVHQASTGNYEPITQFTVDYRHMLGALKIGLLLSEICTTDVPRIHPTDIDRLTAGTFMGDTRVREVIRVCKKWPKGSLSPDFGDPVATEIPLLLWTGRFDSASRPDWVKEARRFLPKSVHIVVNEAHTPSGACVDNVTHRFLNKGSARGLNKSCAQNIGLPPFEISD